MDDFLKTFSTPYIDSQTLLAGLKGYRNPRNWIVRQVKKGALIRLKNGFYLIASKFKQGQDFPFEQLGNLLYGPSYVSLEWALSFYQFIPEGVKTVTNVTLARSKEFKTPIGPFSYRHISQSRYTVGVRRQKALDQIGGFLIATTEKALADWVFFTCQGLNQKELLIDLLEAKRIEKEKLQSLDLAQIEEIAKNYKSEIVHKLYKVLQNL